MSFFRALRPKHRTPDREPVGRYIAARQETTRTPDIKSATRILRELAKDALKRDPSMPRPSTWIIRCLVNSHFCGHLESNWRTSMTWTLTHIIHCAEQHNGSTNTFVELDGKTSLFPSTEGFSVEDTHTFAQTLLAHLREQHIPS